MAKHPMEMRLETITPERAKADLEAANGKNYRGMNMDRARAIAEAIKGNRYEVNGETVKYNGDGTLCDGQHRMMGCVLAGKPFTTWVAYNVASDANIDTGMPRRFGLLLKKRGHKYYHELASALVWLYRWERGSVTGNRPHIPNSELLLLLKKSEGLEPAVEAVGQFDKKLGVRGPLSAFLYKARQSNPGVAEWFAHRLGTGLDLKPLDAVFHLRKRLLTPRKELKTSEAEKLALTIKAWNLTLDGTPCRLLTWRAAGPGAEDFPEMR